MADNTKLLLLGGAAAAVWWFYIRKPAAAVPTVPSVPTSPVNTNPIMGANTVAAIEGRVLLAAKPPAAGLSIDEWGYFVNQELAPLGKTAPDPMPLFQAASAGFDRAQKITAPQYWAVMEPALKAQGMSGLGIYGGLHALVRRYVN